MTPTEAIECSLVRMDELKAMACYAFLRDPVDRFFSTFQLFALAGPFDALPKSKEAMVTSVGKYFDRNTVEQRPQIEYFFVRGESVVTPLLFEQFPTELKELVKSQGGIISDEVPNLNLSFHGIRLRELVAEASHEEKLRRSIRTRYQDDYDFLAETLQSRRKISELGVGVRT